MKATFIYFLLLSWVLTYWHCQPDHHDADWVILNAHIDTQDTLHPQAQAMALHEGRIMAVGSDTEIRRFVGKHTRTWNMKGAYISPGFIEGHGHLQGLGEMLSELDLLDAPSFDTIIALVQHVTTSEPEGNWITGRGWHQEKWEHNPDGHYPTHHMLSAISPHHPVLLHHASGHAILANAEAMRIAGISAATPDPDGGHIVRDKNGQPTGVFEENAEHLIVNAYEKWTNSLSESWRLQQWKEQILLAQQTCFENGITSFQDAGTSWQDLQKFKDLAERDSLRLRLWVMLLEPADSLSKYADQFPVQTADWLYANAVKAYLDGALGSFGAWMLQPYTDQPEVTGQLVTPVKEIEQMAQICARHNMQFCVHAIGDRANRQLLDVYERTFSQDDELAQRRWRIEHAQHLHPADIPRFGQLGVIASMQGIHCTSDAPFVEKRLGEQRARSGAYPWRSLLDAGARIANGTDTPVERIDPRAGLYAAVTRKRPNHAQAFYPEQTMTRAEALYSYTLGNAYAAFQEAEKGSLTVGKLADFVVWDTDLRNCSASELLSSRVLNTVVGGQLVYSRQENAYE